jgi:hypothetical protein
LPLPQCLKNLHQDKILNFLAECCESKEAENLWDKLQSYPGRLISFALKERNHALIHRLLQLDPELSKKELLTLPSSLEELKAYFLKGHYVNEVMAKMPISSWPLYLSTEELDAVASSLTKFNLDKDSLDTLWEIAAKQGNTDLADHVLSLKAQISGRTIESCIFDAALRDYIISSSEYAQKEFKLIFSLFKKAVASPSFDVNAPLDPNDPYSRPVWKILDAYFPANAFIVKGNDAKLRVQTHRLAPQMLMEIISSCKKIDWNLRIIDQGRIVSLPHHFLKKYYRNYYWNPISRNTMRNLLHSLIRAGIDPYASMDLNGLTLVDHYLLWSRTKNQSFKDTELSPRELALAVKDEFCKLLHDHQAIGTDIWNQTVMSHEILIAAFHHPSYRKRILLESSYIRKLPVLWGFLQYAFLPAQKCIDLLKNDFKKSEREISLPRNSQEAVEFFAAYGFLPFDAVPHLMSVFSESARKSFAQEMNGENKTKLLKNLEDLFQKWNQSIETQLPWKDEITELLRMEKGKLTEVQVYKFQDLLQRWWDLKVGLREISAFCKLLDDSKILQPDAEKLQALEGEVQKLFSLFPQLSQLFAEKISRFQSYGEESLKSLGVALAKESELQEIEMSIQSDAIALKEQQESLHQELRNWKKLLGDLDISKELQVEISSHLSILEGQLEAWARKREVLRTEHDPNCWQKKYDGEDSLVLISNLVLPCLKSVQNHNSGSFEAIAEYLGLDLQQIYSYLSNGADLAVLGIETSIGIACDLYEKQKSNQADFLKKIREALENRKARLQSLRSKKTSTLLSAMWLFQKKDAKDSEDASARSKFLEALKDSILKTKSNDLLSVRKSLFQLELQQSIETIDRLIAGFATADENDEFLPCLKEIRECDYATRRLLLRMFCAQEKLPEILKELLGERTLSQDASLAALSPKGFHDLKNLRRLNQGEKAQESSAVASTAVSKKRKRE